MRKPHIGPLTSVTIGEERIVYYSRQSLAARVLIRAPHIISAQFALESFGYQQPWHDSSFHVLLVTPPRFSLFHPPFPFLFSRPLKSAVAYLHLLLASVKGTVANSILFATVPFTVANNRWRYSLAQGDQR